MGIRVCVAVLLVVLPLYTALADSRKCFGAKFITVANEFKYKALIADTDCDLSNTRMTRLFMLGACCKERNNNFGGLPPQCPPGDWNVYTTDTDTCGSVFEDALPNDIRRPPAEHPFDNGRVCNDGVEGVIFVETDCQNLTASSVQLHQWPGGPDFCWTGHTLSRGALAGIIAGSIVGIIAVFGVPMGVYAWYWRRQRRRQAAPEALEKGRCSSTRLETVKIADSAFVSREVGSSTTYKTEDLGEHPYPYDDEYEQEVEECGPVKTISLQSLGKLTEP